MKSLKLSFAAAAFLATAAIPSVASAVTVTQDITNVPNGFTDTFSVSGINKGAFSTSFGVATPSAGTFDVSVLLNESASGIQSLTALLNGAAITLTRQGSSLQWYGLLEQNLTSAGLQNITLSGTSAADNKMITGAITFAAATPEPAAWVLMIAGLGFVGTVMRRKRDDLALT